MKTFLLEIGTEELPAGYIDPALKALSLSLTSALSENGIAYGAASTFGTPRRLAVMITDVAEKQSAVSREVMGPPEKIALDPDGTPLVPARKFAEKIGVSPKALFVKQTDKGGYIAAELTQKGKPAKKILADLLCGIILSVPFPKTMRWSDLSLGFARPIQFIVSLLGEEVIGFRLGNLKSGRFTTGHRFISPKKISVRSSDQYLGILQAAHVLADVNERKGRIRKEIARAAKQLEGAVLPDSELVDVVTHLVEYPAVCAGAFDEKFLALPDEILITAMREHQKYFAVTDGRRLLPHFIVVNNTPAKDMALVARGHERVLRARLEDAMFFYQNDVSHSLEKNVEKLKGVLFQANLGSMYEKTQRVGRLASDIAAAVAGQGDAADAGAAVDEVKRAAYLCKADLVSQVVVEFPKLQGMIGRIYAAGEGEPEEVAAAIEEHYRPTYSGGPLPQTLTGAVLGVADKLDTICGCFWAGLTPSGASDPYGLRRQGIGIIQITLDKGFHLSLPWMIEASLSGFSPDTGARFRETARRIHRFLRDRMANMMVEEGFAKDVIAAVTEVFADSVIDAWKRVAALQNLKQAPDYAPLAVAFKRVANIIKKSGSPKNAVHTQHRSSPAVAVDLFEKPCEAELLAAFHDIEKQVGVHAGAGDFDQALKAMASLRDPVDAFFEGVMVMTENEAVRSNRLALLARIASLFETVADFSKLST